MTDKPLYIRETVSKRKLIDAGKTLFFKYGYRKVTVEEICKSAGISKMTFYRFFGNKIDLLRFILTKISDDGMKSYSEIMNQNISFEEKIRTIVQMKLESAEQFSDELLKDVYDDLDKGLMIMLQKMTGEIMIRVMADFKVAQEQGHIRKDLNLAFIPYFLNQINNLVKDPVLLDMYHGNIREVMTELTNFFFYGILIPGEKMQNE